MKVHKYDPPRSATLADGTRADIITGYLVVELELQTKAGTVILPTTHVDVLEGPEKEHVLFLGKVEERRLNLKYWFPTSFPHILSPSTAKSGLMSCENASTSCKKFSSAGLLQQGCKHRDRGRPMNSKDAVFDDEIVKKDDQEGPCIPCCMNIL